ncbi:hypothetical protein IMY05_C4864000100 [Salix suchowensis]|nr:hypothetical protein IMY05_C4864000100 [Salix suchowensis]
MQRFHTQLYLAGQHGQVGGLQFVQTMVLQPSGRVVEYEVHLVDRHAFRSFQEFRGCIKGLNRFLDASIICNGMHCSAKTPCCLLTRHVDQSIDLGPTGSKHLRRATMEEIIAISKLPEHKASTALTSPAAWQMDPGFYITKLILKQRPALVSMPFEQNIVHESDYHCCLDTLQALEVLAKNVKIEHLNILKPLQQYYTHIIRFNVLDFDPVMERVNDTFDQLHFFFSLTVHEVDESHIIIAHLSRLKIVLQTIHFILYKVAARKKEEEVDINLEEVIPDESLTNRMDGSSSKLCLMSTEDKVTLADGSLGLLTGLLNGTWCTGTKMSQGDMSLKNFSLNVAI